MEPISGLELIEQSNTQAKFVVVTSHLTEAVKEEAMANGATLVISKPILEDKIKNVMQELGTL